MRLVVVMLALVFFLSLAGNVAGAWNMADQNEEIAELEAENHALQVEVDNLERTQWAEPYEPPDSTAEIEIIAEALRGLSTANGTIMFDEGGNPTLRIDFSYRQGCEPDGE